MSLNVAFSKQAFEQFHEWRLDKKMFEKLYTLIKDTQRHPFEGLGKPEPLKEDLSGYWSRRINDEHRLVYQVTENHIYIISCKYHYPQ